ncbi:pro-opiomelanocortin-like [Synchiropus picturatus]
MEKNQGNNQVWRMNAAWLTVAVLLLCGAKGAASQCWDHPKCQVISEGGMMECTQLCRSDFSEEQPLLPGDSHLQPASAELDLSPAPASQEKRSYSMEHFRWGKPVGRKREAALEKEEEPSEDAVWEVREERRTTGEDRLQGPGLEKKDGSYKMKHFRWSGPPASRRSLKSWGEQTQRSLTSLLKTMAGKDPQQ